MSFLKFFVVILFLCGNAYSSEVKSLEPLYINNSKNELIKFDVEIAKTAEEQQRGLMYRTQMPEYQGMLFLFQRPKVVNMWMRNTYIPLDILFIDKNGVIKKIVKNATPNSLKTLSSEISVIAALEINAMMSDTHFIEVDDVILHPFFNNIKDIDDNR